MCICVRAVEGATKDPQPFRQLVHACCAAPQPAGRELALQVFEAIGSKVREGRIGMEG